jgi:hypothetical protein
MRHLPQVDCCATLNALFPTQGATLAEAFARLPEPQASALVESKGVGFAPGFDILEPAEAQTALSALTRYRELALAGAL